ncbi:MAG: hypothetical protein SFX19_08545 [Alphaproteobacteria bacterium]|nr:hypothetical protein [Alphaproteobacteria bacterium]
MTSYLLWNGVHRLRGAEEKQEQSLQETRIKDGNIVLDEEVFTQSGLTTTTADEEK